MGFAKRCIYLCHYEKVIKYKLDFDYRASVELQEVPWGISPSQLKFVEKLELLEEKDKTLKYRGYPYYPSYIYTLKESTINYYFNECEQFYSVKIDIIVEKDDLFGSLFDVLDPWIGENYLIVIGNTESVIEVLMQKYDASDAIISCTFTNEKLVDKRSLCKLTFILIYRVSDLSAKQK